MDKEEKDIDECLDWLDGAGTSGRPGDEDLHELRRMADDCNRVFARKAHDAPDVDAAWRQFRDTHRAPRRRRLRRAALWGGWAGMAACLAALVWMALARPEAEEHEPVMMFTAVHESQEVTLSAEDGAVWELGDRRYPAWPPILKRELDGPESLIRRIQEKDRFLHVPYHSFDSFIRLLQEAAVSKEVDSIKMTLYRLAKESKVVKALIGAARNGKKVTVVIELLARFDEASNINWSKRMQEAGIKVIFGVEGLKVHSKLVHIGMKRGTDVACISTGNFHEGNARTYTDCMLMTASRRLVKDVDSVFSFIERPYSPIRFKELLVSPNEMKNKFVTLINNEIKNKKSGKPAYIKIKINHITDPVMVEKLYEASRAGVDIDLLVRGNCSLVTGIPDVSDHIRIHGIIDRYLEHSRIFVFAAGGEERVFIGSADWMTRNLDHRVEVVTPIYDPAIKEEMKRIVDYGFCDTLQARIVDGEGKNLFCEAPEGEPPFRSQEALYEYYREAEQSNEEKGNDDD